MIVAVPEPEVPFIVETQLFLREHEIIHSELRALRYLVRIRVVEVQDWRTPPSSIDHGPSDRTYHHGGANGGGGAGGAAGDGSLAEPILGPGSGATFRAMPSLRIGKMLCPVQTGVPGHSFGRKAQLRLIAGTTSPQQLCQKSQ